MSKTRELPKIDKINKIDFNQFKFTALRQKTGRRFINVFYQQKVLQVALPKLRIPYNSQISRYGALEFSVSLDNRQDLIDKFEELDKKMLEFAKQNNWFKDDNFNYIPLLKRSENNKYPPTLKLKISKKDGEFVTRIYDENKEEVNITQDKDVLDNLKLGNMVLSLIEFGGVWFSKLNDVETFGLFLKVDHIRVYPPSPKVDQLSEYIFEDSSSDLDDYAFSD